MKRTASTFQLGLLVHDVARLRSTVLDRILKPFGMTRAQWWILSNLAPLEQGVVQSKLAEILEIGKVTLGGLVDRLEDRGYVTRGPVRGDRRAKRVTITPKGTELLEKCQSITQYVNAEIMSGISAPDVHCAEAVLQKMRGRLVILDAPRGSIVY